MPLRNPDPAWRRFLRSFATKLTVLALVFITVPLILYSQFRSQESSKTRLLHDTVIQQDHLIVEVLTPYIEKFGQSQPHDLQNTLNRLSDGGTNIKLLYRPNNVSPKGFFYIASAPMVSPDYLEEERQQLIKLGIFNDIEDTCGDIPDSAARFTNPTGGEEILTSLTSLSTTTGCWAVVTSRSGQALLQVAANKPAWQTPSMQLAAAIYALSAALIIWLFADIWRNVSLFRAAARAIRLHGAGGASFGETNRIPELAGVAEDFDTLVRALVESQTMMKRAAEENAHALKGPLAVIAQSLEPLKRAITADNADARRSVQIIERSVERLDGIVSAVRELDSASADAVYPRQWKIDLSTLVEKLLTAYATTLATDHKHLELALEPDIHVLASTDLLETVVENVIENAASFTPPDGKIWVALSRAGKFAKLIFADEGPGVEAQYLDKIFERYFSQRPETGLDGNIGRGFVYDHSGLGLWIVKRNMEGVGGTVRVEPRPERGLLVTLEFPVVD